MNVMSPMPGLVVRALDLADPGACARLDAFVADHPEGTIFHRPQWSRMVERGCRQRASYLIAERAGSIVGCLPLTELRSILFGNALVSAGFGTGGGILADGEGAAARLGESAWTLARARNHGSVELRGGPLPGGWIPQQGMAVNFARALPGTEEALLGSIPRRQRAEIRKAASSGLECSSGSDRRHLQAFFRAYGESVRNLGTPVFPRRLFEAALDEFGADADIVGVWKDGEPLAALLNFYFKGVSHAYWGGGTSNARLWRANDMVYFEAMRHAIERGCVQADFGRSRVGTGPYARKRIWGFDETPLIYGVRTIDGATPRDVVPGAPKYRLQVAAWQRLPLWLASRIGPMIARGLG